MASWTPGAGVLQGAAVWCPHPVGWSAARSLAERNRRQPDLLIFEGPSWFSRLALWLDSIDDEVRQGVSAAPIRGSLKGLDASALPLAAFLQRLQTPWIEEALNLHCLQTHLQPILLLSDLTICGFEALARSEVGGMKLNGGQLMDAALAHGLEAGFDRACLTSAARDAGPQLLEHEMLFLNFLPSTIGDPDRLEKQILPELARRGLDLSRAVVEVVESQAMPSPAVFHDSIEVMRSAGCLFAMDDVGTGSADFKTIIDFEPDIVKLDRSLLNLEQTTGCGLLRSLVDCAHSVGALCVAEGIETPDQLEMARSAGADLAQGWLIGRPNRQAQRSFGGHAFVG